MLGTRLILAIWVFLLSECLAACGRQAPEYEVIVIQGDALELTAPEEASSPVRFYTYKSGDKNVNFFIRRDRDGIVRTHFDACYSCFKYKMGYVHEGNQVVCRACRIGYDLGEPIWDFVGPCAPITLSSKVSAAKLRIRRRDLEKGAQFF